MLARIKSLLRGRKDWVAVERFNPGWRERISMMAKHIAPADIAVVDLGCGPMWLREYLPPGVGYVGIDYTHRGEGSIVCDLNKDPLPNIEAKVYFASGFIEYMNEPDETIRVLASRADKCIVSYCGTEHFKNIREREARGWKNHLRNSDVTAMFAKHGMTLVSSELTPSNNAVFVFTKSLHK